jgi:hypothetical protein
MLANLNCAKENPFLRWIVLAFFTAYGTLTRLDAAGSELGDIKSSLPFAFVAEASNAAEQPCPSCVTSTKGVEKTAAGVITIQGRLVAAPATRRRTSGARTAVRQTSAIRRLSSHWTLQRARPLEFPDCAP